MTATQATVGVKYTGDDTPFVDRLYKTGLTFSKDQVRHLPPATAERFLRHEDVFERAEKAKAEQQPDQPATEVNTEDAPATGGKPAEAGTDTGANTNPETGNLTPEDDTAAQLAAGEKAKAEQQEQQNTLNDLLQSLDRMDKTALREYAKEKFGETIHPNTGEGKVRDTVRSLVEKFGVA